MKRSEILTLLEIQFMTRGMCGPEYALVAANEILQSLENVGMLPPFSSKIYIKHWRDNVEGYEWEPEVESNDERVT